MKCPGQDMQYWTAEAIFEVDCPECGKTVEFYKDDTTRSCSGCGHRFVNPKMDFGCAAYCKFAEQCIGTLPEEFVGSQDNLLKDKVAVQMKRFYKTDFKQIGHLSRLANHAEKIGKEEGVNLAIVLCSAYLKNIASGAADSDITADSILKGLGAKDEICREVCDLLESLNGSADSFSREAAALADADSLARLEDRNKLAPISDAEFEQFLTEDLLTDGGRKVARTVLGRPAMV